MRTCHPNLPGRTGRQGCGARTAKDGGQVWGGCSGPRRVTVGGVVCGHRGRYTQKQCATLLPLPGNSDGQVAEDEDALMLLMEEDGKLGRPMSSRGPGGRRHRWPWCLPGPSGRGLLAALGNLPAAQPGSESALSSAQRSRRHCSARGLCTRSKANGPCARPRPASVPACPPRVKGAGLTVRGWAGLGGLRRAQAHRAAGRPATPWAAPRGRRLPSQSGVAPRGQAELAEGPGQEEGAVGNEARDRPMSAASSAGGRRPRARAAPGRNPRPRLRGAVTHHGPGREPPDPRPARAPRRCPDPRARGTQSRAARARGRR